MRLLQNVYPPEALAKEGGVTLSVTIATLSVASLARVELTSLASEASTLSIELQGQFWQVSIKLRRHV